MRIFGITGRTIIIEVDSEELDTIVNNALEDEWRKGYDSGMNDNERLHAKEETAGNE